MTVQKMITKLGLYFNDDDIEQDTFLSAISDSIRMIQDEGFYGFEIADHTVSFTTSSKDLTAELTPIYAKQGGIREVYYTQRSAGYQLDYLVPSARVGLDYTTTGTPRWYWLEGSTLNIYPTPASATDILFTSYDIKSEITDISTEVPIPIESQMTVYYGAGVFLCQILEDFNDKLTYFESKFAQGIKKLSKVPTTDIYNQHGGRVRSPLDKYNLPIVQ